MDSALEGDGFELPVPRHSNLCDRDGSHQTHCWSKPDSNSRSQLRRYRCEAQECGRKPIFTRRTTPAFCSAACRSYGSGCRGRRPSCAVRRRWAVAWVKAEWFKRYRGRSASGLARCCGTTSTRTLPEPNEERPYLLDWLTHRACAVAVVAPAT
jgi:hypothetical protein